MLLRRPRRVMRLWQQRVNGRKARRWREALAAGCCTAAACRQTPATCLPTGSTGVKQPGIGCGYARKYCVAVCGVTTRTAAPYPASRRSTHRRLQSLPKPPAHGRRGTPDRDPVGCRSSRFIRPEPPVSLPSALPVRCDTSKPSGPLWVPVQPGGRGVAKPAQHARPPRRALRQAFLISSVATSNGMSFRSPFGS